jgi:hypothetical protein
MVLHNCNPSTWEAEAGGLWVWGQPGLYSKFQASLEYILRPCLKEGKKVCVCAGGKKILENELDFYMKSTSRKYTFVTGM